MTNFSAERLWETDRALPQQVQIGVNINMLDIGERSDGSLEAPFVFTVSFTPPMSSMLILTAIWTCCGRARIVSHSLSAEKFVMKIFICIKNRSHSSSAEMISSVLRITTAGHSVRLHHSVNQKTHNEDNRQFPEKSCKHRNNRNDVLPDSQNLIQQARVRRPSGSVRVRQSVRYPKSIQSARHGLAERTILET